MRRPGGDRSPRVVAEDPIAEPSSVQAFHIGLGCDGGLQESAHRHAARVLAQLLLEDAAGGPTHERFAHRRVMTWMLARGDVDEASAGDRDRRAGDPQHEPVVDSGRDRTIQVQLHPALSAGSYLVRVEHDDAAAHLRGPCMQQELGAVADGVRRGGDDSQRGVGPARRLDRAGVRQHVTSRQLVLIHAAEVRRDAAARSDRFDLLVVTLQPAHPHEPSAGHGLHLFADLDRPVDESAGDHGAETADGEDPVDRKARAAEVRARLGTLEQTVKCFRKLAKSTAGRCRDRDHVRAFERGAFERGDDLRLDELEPVALDQVDLGQHDQASSHLQQIEDLEMLACLRHHTFIRRHHEQHGIQTLRPGQHVAHQPRVTAHVDDADLAAAGQAHVCETQVDGHPATLFFGQPVGVDPGQGGDQRRFAVVDVARRADDEAHFRNAAAAVSTASISVSSSPFNTVRGSRQHSSFSMRASTGGLPWRSAVASREAGPATASSTVGRSCSGSEPPPTADEPSIRRVSTPRSASFTDHIAARRRTSATGVWSMRSTGIWSAWPVSRWLNVASRAASVSLSMRTARASGWRAIFLTASAPFSPRPSTIPACGPPRSLSPENVTTSECWSDSATVGSSPTCSIAPLPRSSPSKRSWRRATSPSWSSEAVSVKTVTRKLDVWKRSSAAVREATASSESAALVLFVVPTSTMRAPESRITSG